MDVFGKLEERIDKLVTAYKGLQARVVPYVEENERLREEASSVTALEERLATLEAERAACESVWSGSSP